MSVYLERWARGTGLQDWPVPDVRIAQFATGSAPTRIAEANPRRIALVISNNGSTDIYLGFAPDVADGTGVLLPAGNNPLMLSGEHDAAMSMRQWYAVSGGGTSSVVVIETVLI